MSWLSSFLGQDADEAAKAQRDQAAAQATQQQTAQGQAAAQQAASLGGAQTAIANQMQGQYAGFDPNAFARQQTEAASNASAAAARGAGANAGKAARLGNVGIQNAQANAIGQGYGIQGNLGQQAYNARAGITGGYGGMSQQAGNLGLGYAGLNTTQNVQEQAQKRQTMQDVGGAVSGLTGGVTNWARGLPTTVSTPPSAYAEGGHVEAGTPAIVGEKGAELIVPDKDSTIIPHNEISKHSKKLFTDFYDIVKKYKNK